MSYLLARVGHLVETRQATQTLWHRGKRKQEGWLSSDHCHAGAILRQRRGYSDDKVRPTGEQQWPFSTPQDTAKDESPPTPNDQPREESAFPWDIGGGRLSTRHPVARNRRLGNAFPTHRIGRETRGPAESFFEQSDVSVPRKENAKRSLEKDQEAVWEQFETIDDGAVNPREVVGREDAHADERMAKEYAQDDQNALLLQLDYKEQLSGALLRGESDVVARCMFAANGANDIQWLRSIPASTFTEILRILEPRNYVAKVASTHLELSQAMARHMGVSAMHTIAFKYAWLLRQVIAVRRSAGLKPGLPDYTILLRSARDLAHKWSALKYWGGLLDDGHEPDTTCYNYYMSAIVWNGNNDSRVRQKVRAIPFHLIARRRRKRPKDYRKYRTSGGGVRERTMHIFNGMIKSGTAANEESFRILMVAAAREGDMTIVKSIMNKVWGIDVDAFLAGQDESTITPRAFPDDSPLRPTSSLLFVIAHAFGVNNDIPTALRLVDFVARHYELQITTDVWHQLFEWTYVLSIKRHGTSLRDGSNTGHLPPQSVLSLWDTMTSAPYFVDPGMGMYNHLIKNLEQRAWTPLIREKMDEGRVIYDQHRAAASLAFEELKSAIARQQNNYSLKTDQPLEALRNHWEHCSLIATRDLWWLKRWMKLLLSSFRDWTRADATTQLCTRDLPAVILDWYPYVPTHVRYETMTGFVEFDLRTEEEDDRIYMKRARSWTEEEEVLRKTPKFTGADWIHRRPRDARRLGRRKGVSPPQDQSNMAYAPFGQDEELQRPAISEDEYHRLSSDGIASQ